MFRLGFFSTSSMKQQSAGRHVALFGHINLIKSQLSLFLLLNAVCLVEKKLIPISNTKYNLPHSRSELVFDMIQTGLKPTIYRTRDPNGAQTHNLPHSRSEPNPQSTALVIRTGFKPTTYRTRDQNRAQTHNLPHSRSEQGSNHNLPHSRSERGSNPQSTALEIRTLTILPMMRLPSQRE